MRRLFFKAWKDNKPFILFMVLMFIFRSALADWNTVPTGSMKPTILEGDRILVNKMAYDIRLPFTHISLHRRSDPERGDIIIFDSKVSEKRLVKRVIGIPGDTIEMKDNIVHINGHELSYLTISSNERIHDKLEHLLGVEHVVRVERPGSILSRFEPVKVPTGFYLALGDNRDNSADSRVIGLVPRHEIIGRTKRVVMSFNYNHYYIPRSDRFFHTL